VEAATKSSEYGTLNQGDIFSPPHPLICTSDHIYLYRHCIYILHGHTSTIRSLQVLHNRPIAVTGSRDSTLRVWDIQRGRCLRVLEGHHQSVRCLDVCGNRAVSGSYDNTCRVSVRMTEGYLLLICSHLALGYRYWRMYLCFTRSSSSDILCCIRWCKDCFWRFGYHDPCLGRRDRVRIISFQLTFSSYKNKADRECLALLQGHTA
jgi:WD40 repeat protein